MKAGLLLMFLHVFVLSVTAQKKSTDKCERLLAKLSNKQLDYMISYPEALRNIRSEVLLKKGTLARRIADEYGNTVLSDLVLLLNDKERDYAVNLLLYNISGKSAYMLTRYKSIDEWRQKRKDTDVAEWKEYMWRISFSPSDTGRLLTDVSQDVIAESLEHEPYNLYYNWLRDNDSSEYQLFVMSDLFCDAWGGILYYNSADSSGMMFNRENNVVTKIALSDQERMRFRQQLSGITGVNYLSLSGEHLSAVSKCLYIVKKGKEIIFQYQGLNKDLQEFEHAGDERIQPVIQVVKDLMKNRM